MVTEPARTSPGALPAGVAVPAYAHPAVAPEAWRRLETLDLGAGFIILNIANGPGEAADTCFAPIVRSLLGRGQTVCGYIDTGYGQRAFKDIHDEAARYRAWYGVDAVFLDRFVSSGDRAEPYRDVVDRLRDAGTMLVVLNPGVVPDREVALLGDVVVTFEGPWAEHRRLYTSLRARDTLSTTSVCHLVHSTPRQASLPRIVARATAAGAGIVGISFGVMPNPWSVSGQWLA